MRFSARPPNTGTLNLRLFGFSADSFQMTFPRPWRALQPPALVAGWLIFAVLWLDVVTEATAATARLTGLLLTATLVLSVTLNLAWVAYNLGIYRQKGARLGIKEVGFEAEQDFLGRPLVADWPALKDSAFVTVTVQDGSKLFVAHSEGGLAIISSAPAPLGGTSSSLRYRRGGPGPTP